MEILFASGSTDVNKTCILLYKTYFSRLVRFANIYVCSSEDAENIVQDLFLHLWENKDKLSAIRKPDSFLFSSVKNRCIDFLRSQIASGERHSLSTVEQQEYLLKLYSIQMLDETQLNLEEIETLLLQAIEALPERCREIFTMSKLQGMKYKEIAETLHLSVNTIENQMSYALKKLRVGLQGALSFLLFALI